MNAKVINMSLCVVIATSAFSLRALGSLDNLFKRVPNAQKNQGSNATVIPSSKETLQNINFAELLVKAKDFAAHVVEVGKGKVAEAGIKEVAEEAISKLPDNLLGIDISAVKTKKMVITAAIAHAIAAYLPVAISSLDKVDAVAKMAEFSPELAIGMLETANNLGFGASLVPAELKTVANKAFDFIKSRPEEFRAVMVPVGNLVEYLRNSLETLRVSAKAVAEGKNPLDFIAQLHRNIINKISSKEFSDLKDKVFDQIDKLIKEHGPAVKELVEKLSKASELITKQISK